MHRFFGNAFCVMLLCGGAFFAMFVVVFHPMIFHFIQKWIGG